MSWFKVDDGFWAHPKTLALPAPAVALWVRAGSWSAQQLTDGHVPRSALAILGAKPRDAAHLVTAGLWTTEAEGWRFHDWKEYQPSRADVAERRERTAEKVRSWRERKRASNPVTDAVTNQVTDPVSNPVGNPAPGPARPGPTPKPFLLTLISRLAAGEVGPPPAEVVASWQDLAGPGVDLEAEAAAYLSRFGDRPPRDERGAWIGWLRKAAERTAGQAPAASSSSGRRPERAACPSHPDQPATTCAACTASTPLPEGGLRALVARASVDMGGAA